MKRVIGIIVVSVMMWSCAPIDQEMADNQSYDDILATYKTVDKNSPDQRFDNLDSRMDEYLGQYPASSYVDNVTYYRGRLNQQWGDYNSSLKIEKYNIAISVYKEINSKAGFYNEGLFRIAEVMDSLSLVDSSVSKDVVASAYKKAFEIAPTTVNGKLAEERFKVLNNG